MCIPAAFVIYCGTVSLSTGKITELQNVALNEMKTGKG